MSQILEVQGFLKTKTFGELQREWGVYARCNVEGYKFSLNYDAQEFTPGHKPTEQCRGLILATERKIPHKDCKVDVDFCPGETSIMAYPFDKFYNEHEQFAAKLNWDKNLLIQDKLDGTLIILYHDYVKDAWCVATRSVPDADLSLDGHPDMTFRKLFERGVQTTFNMSFDQFTDKLPSFLTYMFELTGPYNRIFVNYKEIGVTLLGSRLDLKELTARATCDLLNFEMPIPKTWNLHSAANVQEFVNGRSPEECEGAVIIDPETFDRIKIKNINWVTANATKTNLGTSPRNLMRYIIAGIADDITAMLPEDLRQKLFDMRDGLDHLCKSTDAKVVRWKAEAGDNRKRFAELVLVDNVWPPPAFEMFVGRHDSAWGYLKDLHTREKLGESQLDFLIKLTAKQ